MSTQEQPQIEGQLLSDMQRSRNYALLLKGLVATRLVFTLAIVSTFVAAVALLVLGTIETFHTVGALLGFGGTNIDPTEARLHFIEVVDLFLVATIMYVISIGIYQLFADPRLPVSPWLRVRSASDLEHKLVGVIITVLSVESLAQVASWNGQANLLSFGLTTALLIAALAYFIVNRHRSDDDADEDEDDR